MAFVSRKRVGAMRGRRWIRSFARPAVAVVAAMREEQRRSKRVGSFRAEGVAEARRARRACSGDWFVAGWSRGGGGGGGEQREEGDAAFCEAFCDEMGPAVLLPRNEHPEMQRIASTPCGVFLLSRRVHDNCQSTELSISGRKYQLRQKRN